jgi:hypothetical protein
MPKPRRLPPVHNQGIRTNRKTFWVASSFLFSKSKKRKAPLRGQRCPFGDFEKSFKPFHPEVASQSVPVAP